MSSDKITQHDQANEVPVKIGEVDIPMELPTIANKRDHWSKTYRRDKAQKGVVTLMVRSLPRPELPIIVRLIRCSPRKLDSHDNLICAFGAVVDAIADWLRPGHAPGQADNTDQITWHYAQESAKEKRVRIELYRFIPGYTQNQV